MNEAENCSSSHSSVGVLCTVWGICRSHEVQMSRKMFAREMISGDRVVW